MGTTGVFQGKLKSASDAKAGKEANFFFQIDGGGFEIGFTRCVRSWLTRRTRRKREKRRKGGGRTRIKPGPISGGKLGRWGEMEIVTHKNTSVSLGRRGMASLHAGGTLIKHPKRNAFMHIWERKRNVLTGGATWA